MKLLLALFGLASATLSDCGLGKSLFKIQDQGFSPSPPISGEEYIYWFSYSVPPDVFIDSGKAEYSVTLNGIPLTPSVDVLCSQTVCPKTDGVYNETSHDVWPSGVSGKVQLKLSWYDDKDNLLLCSQVTERV